MKLQLSADSQPEEILPFTNVWMWGHGGYNRLAQGKKDTKHRGAPVQAKMLRENENIKFSDLACGAAHIVGLTVDNKVYTWGS